MGEINTNTRLVKLASPKMAATSTEVRNNALQAIKTALLAASEEIFVANKKDLEEAAKNNVAAPIMKRLKFDQGKMDGVISGLDDLTKLPDPIARTVFARELDQGLVLKRITCPIGVIGVIFEARPDALIQISSLCIKSGNCCILKGGSETTYTNRVLFEIIYKAVIAAGCPRNCMLQLEARSEIAELLSCDRDVDLLIPRGSNAFVQYIMNNTKIPVMGHADGICHIYVDKDADISKAIPVIIDAKTQYVSACNTVETLLVHEEIAPLLMPALKEAFDQKKVTLKGSSQIRQLVDCQEADDQDNVTEYLDYIISCKTVSDVYEAIDHINMYGSHHTDAIITENEETAEIFMSLVDSAGVYKNASTRFADGYRYGFGAEVGISTSKIHARGPVGLEGLMSYKYRLYGDGHIVADYSEGRKSFNFREL